MIDTRLFLFFCPDQVTDVRPLIHLSRLDEGIAPAMESADLLETAEDAANDLQAAAGQKQVSILVTGRHAKIKGVRNYLYEMVYNLCGNTIKYNLPEGKVEVVVLSEGQGASITIKDTGIGIPAEYQPGIFERFFRVDKSRSKASGGTGLGLSIVKHIVQCHQAEIELQGTVGGATVSVMFPPAQIETANGNE